MKPVKKTCLECGKSFVTGRPKQYCSEACRKRAENRRLKNLATERYPEPIRGESGPTLAGDPKLEKIPEQNQYIEEAKRGDRGPAFAVRDASWIAVNDATDKLQYKNTAIAWTLCSVRSGQWFARIRNEHGNWSFGPSTRSRARKAAEAWIKQEPFEKIAPEATWKGDCMHLV